MTRQESVRITERQARKFQGRIGELCRLVVGRGDVATYQQGMRMLSQFAGEHAPDLLQQWDAETIIRMSIKQHDRAEELRQWFEDWFGELGFIISVPKLVMSNRAIMRRPRRGTCRSRHPVYRPSLQSLPLARLLMTTGDPDGHLMYERPLLTQAPLAPREGGEWIVVEVLEDGTLMVTECGEDKSVTKRRPYLTEYCVFYYAYKAQYGMAIRPSKLYFLGPVEWEGRVWEGNVYIVEENGKVNIGFADYD